MDASDHYEILSGSLVGLVPVVVVSHERLRLCCFTAAIVVSSLAGVHRHQV